MDKIVVPQELRKILVSNFGFESEYSKLRALAYKEFNSLSDIYDFLNKADEYTYGVYGLPDGCPGLETFTFPLEKKSIRGVTPYRGHIGDQTSTWHHESLKDHAAIVTCNLFNAGVKAEIAALLGVLHDCGKKYTAKTGQDGYLTFPNHEKLSALLAKEWLKSCGFRQHPCFPDSDEIDILAAVIFSHSESFGWHKGTEESKKSEEKFFEEMRRYFDEDEVIKIYALTNLLCISDEGVKDEDDIPEDKIRKGRRIIEGVFIFGDRVD